ncbi:HlyD family efflux transporter periplasmic adaptor subunit [Sphingomonas sp. So64.6b]|uniref:efflux RND transporter periplasmic adaptor subunit n=1 Tax=Sphingomonas sp. So64.6b TaxID=2997354 RepID=UPI001603A74A|nr:HlyD family efflux transporter periplasmic adaptor subunit [Sphingomonas sp. So64.6b]QNA82614.1 HlyD family efflux transporter periplasmic adaptor subunit [Sphingomonas sp. So64.6b]
MPKTHHGRIAAALALLCGVLAIWWWWPGAKTASATAMIEKSLVVKREPFNSTINVMGTIAPGNGLDITAPFDGTIKSIRFAYGDLVNQGQTLAELDLSGLEQSRNEAESAYLKAAQASNDMTSWTSGPEVSRARRAATSAMYELSDTENKMRETKALLDRGLVPRSEYDGMIQQQRSQKTSLVAAQEDLEIALRRGQGPNRRLAELDLKNAQLRLAKLVAQFDGAILRAPEDGIIVRPPVDAGSAGAATEALHVGSRLSKGQLIGTIARAGGLGVTFRLDEADINRIRTGMPVMVTGPGFGELSLSGQISSVAGEAGKDSASGTGKASFTATARLNALTPEQAARVKIGMTAMVIVIAYSNPNAIVVPPEAVQGAAPAATVNVRDPKTGKPAPRMVRLGLVSPTGAEILAGLKPGDEVMWSVAPPPVIPPTP